MFLVNFSYSKSKLYCRNIDKLVIIFLKQSINSEMKDNPSIKLLQAFNKERKLCGLFSPLQTIYISEEPPILLGRSASILSISQVIVPWCFMSEICVVEFYIGQVIVSNWKRIISFLSTVKKNQVNCLPLNDKATSCVISKAVSLPCLFLRILVLWSKSANGTCHQYYSEVKWWIRRRKQLCGEKGCSHSRHLTSMMWYWLLTATFTWTGTCFQTSAAICHNN